MNNPPLARCRKLKLVCSFTGTFQPRQPSGKLRYTGGEARIISVDRNIRFARLNLKILELIRCPNKCQHSFSLLYHLPDSESTDEHAPLVSVASDDDVRCMIREFEKLELYSKVCRLWIFVCNDSGFFNFGEKRNAFKNFTETESLNSGLGVFCDKNKTNLNSETVSLYENGFVNQNSLAPLWGGQFVGDKVRKPVKNGNKVKSSEDSLRKMVLKQQLLSKQSARIQSLRCGLGIADEQSEMERAICDNEKKGHASIDLSSKPESSLTCDSLDSSFVGIYGVNSLDYKYNNNHLRNNRSDHNAMGDHKNGKLDRRPWVGKFYPGLRFSSSISKQGQVMRSYNSTSSHQQQVDGEARNEYVLNNETCSFSFSYGSQENLSEQGGFGIPQDGKPNPNECQLSYYDPQAGMADD